MAGNRSLARYLLTYLHHQSIVREERVNIFCGSAEAENHCDRCSANDIRFNIFITFRETISKVRE